MLAARAQGFNLMGLHTASQNPIPYSWGIQVYPIRTTYQTSPYQDQLLVLLRYATLHSRVKMGDPIYLQPLQFLPINVVDYIRSQIADSNHDASPVSTRF